MESNILRNVFSDYGMVFALFALCVLFSLLTLEWQMPQGDAAATGLVARITEEFNKNDLIVAVGAIKTESAPFAEKVGQDLHAAGFSKTRVVVGTPRDLRRELDAITEKDAIVTAIVTAGDVTQWRVLEQIPEKYPTFADFNLITPERKLWPNFLKRTNLLAIVDRIVVIAVIAIGMTLVIITAGIDLSVGSLIALSAVIGTLVMKRLGGLDAPPWVVVVGFSAGILGCGLVGGACGFLVTRFKIAPFITTLSLMLMARGLARKLSGGFSIYQVPESLSWLGQGRTLGVPNTVILLVVLYAAAHIFMSHTRWGRYIYAVGGNEEAARLSGVPVGMVIVFVYVVCALAAGLGGCIQASQLNTGTPNMGLMYELYVIAAVVVGGTSLSGGSGRILGTLIGAFIISVIQNGMNLLGMESFTQDIVLGAIILIAVLLDKVRGHSTLPGLLKRKQKLSPTGVES